MQLDQLRGAGAQFGIQLRGQRSLGQQRRVALIGTQAQGGAELAQTGAQTGRGGQLRTRRSQPRHALRQRVHRCVVQRQPPRAPDGAQALHQRAAFALQAGFDGLQQHQLLHPAAREGIQRQHLRHDAEGRQMLTPALQFGLLDRGLARHAHLVEQHDHRFAHPGQQRHLAGHVAGRGRLLGRADQVEHDVGGLGHVAQRLLAGPEGPVAPAIPHLAEEPAQRLRRLLHAAQQAHAVTETRRIPQAQRLAHRRAQHLVGVGELGDVRRVAHLADIAAEQRARQRGLAHVGVRHQAELQAVRGVAHDAVAARAGDGTIAACSARSAAA